jgi:hypothetical protein
VNARIHETVFTVSILVCKSLNCKTCQYSNNTFQKKPPFLRGGESPGGGGGCESSVAKTWANSSTSLKIISCPPKNMSLPLKCAPKFWTLAPPLVRGSGLPSLGFYPEISGFFEAVGILFFLFLIVNLGSFGRFYWPINNFAKNPGFVH